MFIYGAVAPTGPDCVVIVVVACVVFDCAATWAKISGGIGVVALFFFLLTGATGLRFGPELDESESDEDDEEGFFSRFSWTWKSDPSMIRGTALAAALLTSLASLNGLRWSSFAFFG